MSRSGLRTGICRSVRRGVVAGVLGVAWSATGTMAQDAGIEGLVPLEPGLEDVGPLGRSERFPRVDLRLPTRFERVYRMNSAPGAGEDRFVRMNGAVAAVFPRSTYFISEETGLMPTVPPGTVFQIGADPGVLLGPAGAGGQRQARGPAPVTESLRAGRVERGVTGRPSAESAAGGLGSSPGSAARPGRVHTHPSIWVDESYRVRRVSYLLRRAAAR